MIMQTTPQMAPLQMPKVSMIQRLSPWALAFVMLTLAPKVPLIAFSGITLAAVMYALQGRLWGAISERLIVLLVVLATCVCLHQFVLLYHDMVQLSFALKMLVFGSLCYWLGYASVFKQRDEWSITAGLIGLGLGFGVVALASAMNTGFLIHGILILPTYARDIITGEIVHKTHMGMYSSLGMCLLPIALFLSPNRVGGWLIWGGIVLAGVSGFMANLATQNRTPLLAAGLSLMLVMALTLLDVRRQKISMERLTWLFIAGSLVVFGAIVAIWVSADTLLETVLLAFDKGSLDTPRYRVWMTILAHFDDYFWGGRQIRLPEFFAHNFWLDVLWDSGQPAFYAWVGFHLLHAWFLMRALFGNSSMVLRCTVACTYVSFLLSFMVEPVPSASVMYMLGHLVFMGVLAALAKGGADSTVSFPMPMVSS
jgi:hypothetical protein